MEKFEEFDILKFSLAPACLTMFNGNIISANSLFSQLFFKNMDIDVTKLNLFKLFENNKEFIAFVISQIKKNDNIHKNSISYINGEQNMFVEVNFKNIRLNDINGLYFQFFDVTQYTLENIENIEYIKNIEKNTGAQTQQLFKEKEIAEENNRKKSEFLASMSHELRTPLNSILGFAELLIAETANSIELNEKINFIYNEGKRLTLLINDILDFSKISDNKLKLIKEYFPIKELIDKLNNLFELRCNDRNLKFIVKSAEDMPEYLFGDIQRIVQILINIIGNSIKFTATGNIMVKFDYDYKNVIWNIEIADTGIGIPQEKINYIFKPFEQIVDSKKKIEGTGLGLSITLQLVKLMKGNLFVKSKVNEGTVFNIKLPLPFKKIDDYKTAAATEPDLITNTPLQNLNVNNDTNLKISEFKGNRILAVDDNPQILKLMDILCVKLGFSVIKAENGKEALMILENSPDFFLVFMDLMMPEMDGIEAIKKIRIIEKLKKLPVVAVTAKSCVKDELLAFGFDDYIRKPFKLQDLVDSINNLTALGKLNYNNNIADSNQQSEEKNKVEETLFSEAQLVQELKDSTWLEDIEIFKIAGEFIATVNDRLVNLEKLFSTADYPAFKMEAHSLKGVAGFLNLDTLSKICAEFESRINNIENDNTFAEDLKKNMAVLKEYVKHLIKIYFDNAGKLGIKSDVEIDITKQNVNAEKIKIFVSEDDFITRRLLKLTFEKFADVECSLFSSAEELLKNIKTDELPDIIFTDIHMGDGMTGLEFSKELREKYNFKNYLVAMTGTSEFVDLDDKELKQYFNQWLLKPVSINVIESVINKYEIFMEGN